MYKILKANYFDFDFIEKIGKNSLPIYYKKDDLIILKNTNHDIFKIINDKDKIVGFIVTRETENNIHILSIAVDVDYRKKGIGTILLDNLKNKSKSVTLYVHTVNDVAMSFYKKNNFKIENIMFGYYDNFKIDKDAYKMIYQSN